MNKKIVVAALAAIGLMAASAVQAQGLVVRARAFNIHFANGQNTLPVSVEAQDKTVPTVDLSWFFTPNIAAELTLTYPQNIDINVAGAKAGTVKALPPQLVLQYHFTNMGQFKPYLGAGINYTIFTKRNNILAGAAEIDRTSLGGVLNAGFDYMIDKNWMFNIDVKYHQISTDVRVAGAKIGKLDLHPTSFAVGLGYKF